MKKLGAIFRHGIFIFKKALPWICSVAASIGVAITGFLSAKASPEAKKNVEKNQTKEDKETVKGRVISSVKYGWRYFVKAIAAGVITVALIITSTVLSGRQIAALAATVSYLAYNRDSLESYINEKLGPEELKNVKRSIDRNMMNIVCSAGPSVEETGRGDQLCYETHFGRWFRSSEVDVRRQLERFSDDFNNGRCMAYNLLYHLLGLSYSAVGERFGYPGNPDYYDEPFQYDASLLEGWTPPGYDGPINESVLVIDIYTSPMEGWLEV